MKKHIGHPVDFWAANEDGLLNGHIEKVRRGIAVIRYYVSGSSYSPEGFMAYLAVNDSRIKEIY